MVVEREVEVKKDVFLTRTRRFPDQACAGSSKRVHGSKEGVMSARGIPLYNQGIVDQATIEEDAMRIAWRNEGGFFVIGIINRRVCACTGRSHCGSVPLFPVPIAESKHIVAHDNIESVENFRSREIKRELVLMQGKPVLHG